MQLILVIKGPARRIEVKAKADLDEDLKRWLKTGYEMDESFRATQQNSNQLFHDRVRHERERPKAGMEIL